MKRLLMRLLSALFPYEQGKLHARVIASQILNTTSGVPNASR
jgi:hypothetical protein